VLPGVAGAELGGSVELAPLRATANRGDSTNPEYKAWQAYELRLPESATAERTTARNMLNSDKVPVIDPAVTDARNRLDRWWTRPSAMATGFLGGTFGAVVPPAATAIGAGALRVPGAIAEATGGIIPRVRAGWNGGAPPVGPGGAQGGPAGGPGANGLGHGIVHQQPPPQPVQGGAAQTGAAYDPAVHGPISRAYLNELLTHGSPTRAALTGLGSVDDQATQAALALQSRYHAANVPLVNQDEMVALASKSLGEYNLLNAALSAQTGANRQITNQALRQSILNLIQGRPGYLSVPPIVAYGMMQGQPDDPMY